MRYLTLAACAASLCTALPAHADRATPRADSHAPIAVMGDHMHKTGEVMLSYRFMHMSMDGNRTGPDSINPDDIVTTIPNRFFGAPMQPPTLRVVPTSMEMDMHMLGIMYAPTDWVTLMAMGMYVHKEMDHITYSGGMGTTELGRFTTNSSGITDTKIGAMFRVYEGDHAFIHATTGVSLPTGSITETDQILTPMGTTPTPRLPYPMQLGSGTFDFQPGITYTDHRGPISWGTQYQATFRLGRNDEGYTLGDVHEMTAWGAYLWAPWVSTSLRVTGATQGRIRGIDPAIVAPVQTADPDFHGGERVDLGFGVNLLGTKEGLSGHRLAIEATLPVYQDLNGPQMERDWGLTAGWQFAF